MYIIIEGITTLDVAIAHGHSILYMVSTITAIENYGVMWCNDVGRKHSVFNAQLATGIELSKKMLTYTFLITLCLNYEIWWGRA